MVENNAKEKYLGKSDGTTLYGHSCMVCDKAIEILDDAEIKDEAIREAVKIAALSHDMGKTMKAYQNYIRMSPEDMEKHPYTKDNPKHNEVSAALFHSIIECFGPNYKSAIESAIRYHHTCTSITKDLDKLYTQEEFNDVLDLYKKMFAQYGIRNVRFNGLEKVMDTAVEPISQFDFIRGTRDGMIVDKKALRIYEIVFNTVRYADIIVSSNGEYNLHRANPNITGENFVYPDNFDHARWDEQIETVEKLKGLDYSILKATMGYGKTLCGLRYLLGFGRLGFWVCPDNSVAQTTYDNIKNTLNSCKVNGVKVSLLLGGTWVKGDENTDIIVTNIDTYENGIFRNSRKSISFKALFANTIFDEYHEYLLDDNPLSAMFLSIVNARKLMGNVKTLLMSGTLANGNGFLDFSDSNIIIPKGLGMEKKKKIRFHYIEANDIPTAISDNHSYFVVYPTVRNCQDAFIKEGIGKICLHSRFDEQDLEEKNRLLFEHNGKNAKLGSTTVSSTSTISRAYDLSFKSAVLINPNPFQILQATGRINRWGYEAEAGDLYIVVDKKSLDIYKDWDTKRTGRLWTDVYLPYIDNLKKRFPDGVIGTVFDIDEYMMGYFKDNGIIREIARQTITKGFRKLREVEFRKGVEIGNGKAAAKHSSDKMDVRGNCMTRFVRVQMAEEKMGQMSGVMALPYYAFDFKRGFDALNERTALSDAVTYYLSRDLDLAGRYLGSKNIERKLKTYKENPGDKLHEVLMKASISDETPYPVFKNYAYNHEIGFFQKR